jgi:hypothetical protein
VVIDAREYTILFAIAASIIGLSVLRRTRRADAARQRATVLARMGFVEETREQVFGGELQAINNSFGNQTNQISQWIGRGNSTLGEAVIFDLSDRLGAPDSSTETLSTVVGFRVGGPVAYFEVTHTDRIQRMAMKVTGFGAGTTPTGQSLFEVPLVSAEKPDLAKQYRVLAADPETMRQALTTAFIDALGRIDGRNLIISKWGTDWLFFHRHAVHPLSPQDYPSVLKEAVDLLSLLDLPAAGALG